MIFSGMVQHPLLADDCAKKARTGGYFCLAIANDLTGPHTYPVGTPNPEKAMKQAEFCREKVERLIAHPEHSLSWQSRDVENGNEKYGGAVRGDKLIVSLSGLPEQADEIFAYAFLLSMGDLNRQQVTKLLRLFPNPFAEILWALDL